MTNDPGAYENDASDLYAQIQQYQLFLQRAKQQIRMLDDENILLRKKLKEKP